MDGTRGTGGVPTARIQMGNGESLVYAYCYHKNINYGDLYAIQMIIRLEL